MFNADRTQSLLQKLAYMPPEQAAPPMDPAMAGAPPMDPSMMGAPPMDPAMMGAPPMDPAMMGAPPMGAPPMDPAMMGAPPMDPAMAGAPPMDPAMAGAPPMDPAMMGTPPEEELAGGMPVVLNMEDLEAILKKAVGSKGKDEPAEGGGSSEDISARMDMLEDIVGNIAQQLGTPMEGALPEGMPEGMPEGIPEEVGMAQPPAGDDAIFTEEALQGLGEMSKQASDSSSLYRKLMADRERDQRRAAARRANGKW